MTGSWPANRALECLFMARVLTDAGSSTTWRPVTAGSSSFITCQITAGHSLHAFVRIASLAISAYELQAGSQEIGSTQDQMSTGDVKRWLYHGQRPNWIAKILNRAWAAVNSSGIASNYLVTLEVIGRKSRRTIALPVAMVDCRAEETTSWKDLQSLRISSCDDDYVEYFMRPDMYGDPGSQCCWDGTPLREVPLKGTHLKLKSEVRRRT
jgi:hypothetical protein